MIKVSYQVTIKYPYIINNPQAFVTKCFGPHFITDSDPGKEIVVTCTSWNWVEDLNTYMSAYLDQINPDDHPKIYDHATIVNETTVDVYDS